MARPAKPASRLAAPLPPVHGARFTFAKQERLCKRAHLEALFAGQGASFIVHPLRVVWGQSPHPIPVAAQVVISVGKKRFKRAVDRNAIKRHIREAYRHLKPAFLAALPPGAQLHFMLAYISDAKPDPALLARKLEQALARLATAYAEREQAANATREQAAANASREQAANATWEHPAETTGEQAADSGPLTQ